MPDQRARTHVGTGPKLPWQVAKAFHCKNIVDTGVRTPTMAEWSPAVRRTAPLAAMVSLGMAAAGPAWAAGARRREGQRTGTAPENGPYGDEPALPRGDPTRNLATYVVSKFLGGTGGDNTRDFKPILLRGGFVTPSYTTLIVSLSLAQNARERARTAAINIFITIRFAVDAMIVRMNTATRETTIDHTSSSATEMIMSIGATDVCTSATSMMKGKGMAARPAEGTNPEITATRRGLATSQPTGGKGGNIIQRSADCVMGDIRYININTNCMSDRANGGNHGYTTSAITGTSIVSVRLIDGTMRNVASAITATSIVSVRLIDGTMKKAATNRRTTIR